jgi:murein DD-endopeptidase MepM/ murein hydrolase activator NlpD
VAKEFPGRSVNPWDIEVPPAVLSASDSDSTTNTQFSEKLRDKIFIYTVQEGDTVSSISQKFDVSQDTIRWQNKLTTKASIKVGQTLEILPVTGVSHKVVKGDTVYSIAKYYDISPQSVVDFPYNTFVNDETFELAIGQTITVPDGVKPAEKVYWSPVAIKQITPNAGSVVASGSFVWPAGGTITQRYVWYHQGMDIANHAAPDVLAADAGVVTVPPFMYGGYGNYVIIDHGNGYRTLYGHMQRIYVVSGQTVARGNAIGKMGSTGRSTGTHCHFEVTRNGVKLNPLEVLK